MNNEIRAYVAGFIDGEGCISITKVRKKRSRSWSYALSLVIGHTNIKPLKFIQEHYGGVIFKAKVARKIWKPEYFLRLGSHASLRAIKDFKQHLILKEKQAGVGIKLMDIKAKYAKPGGVKCDESFIRMQEECKQEMHRLNKKGTE